MAIVFGLGEWAHMCKHWQHDRHAEREVREEDLALSPRRRFHSGFHLYQDRGLDGAVWHPSHLQDLV